MGVLHDYVMRTGYNHTVQGFVDMVFKELDMELERSGENEHRI